MYLRERERTLAGERERERISSRCPAQCGLRTRSHGLTTVRSRPQRKPRVAAPNQFIFGGSCPTVILRVSQMQSLRRGKVACVSCLGTTSETSRPTVSAAPGKELASSLFSDRPLIYLLPLHTWRPALQICPISPVSRVCIWTTELFISKPT